MWLEKTGLECWAYSFISQNILLPLSRCEDCTHRGGNLRACKGCQHRDHTGCIEPRAESVTDPETANFCDYFFVDTTGFYQRAKLAQENTWQQLDLTIPRLKNCRGIWRVIRKRKKSGRKTT